MDLTASTFLDYATRGRALPIHTHPSAVLKKVASPVSRFDSGLEQLCFDMFHTMYKAPGIGLAAPQVGISERLFVMDIDFEREKILHPDGTSKYHYKNFNPRVFINPVIRSKEGEILYEEGCLSFPGIYEEIKRAEFVEVEYQNIRGEKCSLQAEGTLAVCIQHENDHLDGIVFLERLSLLKRNLLVKKFMKQKNRSQA